MNIIYCHHAQRLKGNPSTQEDDITKLGKKDALLVAKLLQEANGKKLQIKAIYSSEFLRCKKTAKLINKYIKVPIILDKRLNEHKSNKNETWVDTQTRITILLKEIIANYNKEDTVICVTSGVNITPFINLAFGVEIKETNPMLGIPSCSPVTFSF